MDQKRYEQLAKQVGPPGVAFVSYLVEELTPRARAAAEAMGMNPAEAEEAADVACAGAIRGFVSSLNTVLKLRRLRS